MAGFARVGVGFIATLLGIFFGFWCFTAWWGHMSSITSVRKQFANLIGFFVIFIGIVLIAR